MKKIPLHEALAILQNCSAVIVDDNALTYPSTDELTGDDDNEFLYLAWDDGNQEFCATFTEGDNRMVKVAGSSMFLFDTDGDDEECQITILSPEMLE